METKPGDESKKTKIPNKLTFKSIRDKLKFEGKYNFKKYMNEIFDFFLLKYQISKGQKMTFTLFLEYFSINGFLADCLFKAFNKGNPGGISKSEFINGMVTLYIGNYEETSKLIFNIFDLNRDGKIKPNNMKLLLSYLPLKNFTHKEQIKSLKEINSIVQDTFKKENELTYEQYSDAILNRRPDSYIQLLTFFYNIKPFNSFSINAFKSFKTKNNDLTKNNNISEIENIEFPALNTETLFSCCETYFSSITENEVYVSDSIPITSKSLNFNAAKKGVKKIKSRQEIRNNNEVVKKGYISPVLSHSSLNDKDKLGNFDLFNLESCDDNCPDIDIAPHLIRAYLFLMNESNVSYSTEIKYFTTLVNKDLLFFTSDKLSDCRTIINLTKAFLTKGEDKCIYKYNFSTVVISFNENKTFSLLFENSETRDKWLKAAKKEIQNEDITDYYKIEDTVFGKGHDGEVKLCIKKSTGEKYAVKIINKDKLKLSEDYELLLREIELMKIIKHKNVINLLDYFEEKHYIYLVMDCLEGGDLITYIDKKENGRVSEKEAAKIIKYISNGLFFIQKFGVIHRDLKPDNIVLMKPNDISSLKIIDFGVSRTVPFGCTLNEPLGTLNYCSPQIVQNKKYSHKLDIWSLGVITYLIITGEYPFDDEDEQKLAKKIKHGNIDFSKDCFKNISKGCINFIDHCMEKEEERRYSIEDVIQDDWLLKYSL